MPAARTLPDTSTRVERHTAARHNLAIRKRTEAAVVQYEDASAEQVAQHIATMDREWDIERVLQLNASVLAGSGVLLGALRDRRFLLLPAVVFSFLLQHALQGWCPPVPVFRRLGVRTAREIARERYALKALRGDFDAVPAPARASVGERVRAALRAVDC